MRVTVYGLWHLGCVTAACAASGGHQIVGLDRDERVVADLRRGRPPVEEAGLSALTAAGLASGRLRFTTDPVEALSEADVLWVTFDTPVDDQDEADVAFVRARLEEVADAIRPGTLVLISSQVPAGFTRALRQDWPSRGLRYAYSPENLRLGRALEAFRTQERIIIGINRLEDRSELTTLFSPFCSALEWMSVESAEMTKHALNAFLATSVTFINEIGRLCEVVGADAKEVERGLKSEGRIGRRAYLAPGSAFAGGTLARDVRFLTAFGKRHALSTPLCDGVLTSNALHLRWLHDKLRPWLLTPASTIVALLGLTYTAGTNTLRRSASVELARWLSGQGVRVRAYDPAIQILPDDLADLMSLHGQASEALTGADIAIVATEWPEFFALTGDVIVESMRRPWIVDQNWFLAGALSGDPRIKYVATGRGTGTDGAS